MNPEPHSTRFTPTPTKNRRCLVTGAAGFLGRYLCRTFAAAGYQVTGVGRGPWPGKTWGLKNFVEVELPCGDLEDILAECKPQVCIHAAGLGEIPSAATRPGTLERQALASLASLLDAATKTSRNSHIVLISSAAVYGQPNHLPVTEAALRQPNTPYGRHKLDCELMVERFAHRSGIRASIARVFNAYGPEQKRQVLWDLCRRAAAAGDEKKVDVYSTGRELRDFLHVEDVARAVLLLAQNPTLESAICNVCSGRPTSISRIVEELTRLWPSPIAFSLRRESESAMPVDCYGEPASLLSLGFEPRWDLYSGLHQYVDWFLTSQEMAVHA